MCACVYEQVIKIDRAPKWMRGDSNQKKPARLKSIARDRDTANLESVLEAKLFCCYCCRSEK